MSSSGGASPLELIVDATADTLNGADPIFASVRADYPEFDGWFEKIRHERRLCAVVVHADGSLDAVVVLKEETDGPYGLAGRTLKICLYKVSERASGVGLGDALLVRVIERSALCGQDAVYAEVFAKHHDTVRQFESFGFTVSERTTCRGELVMVLRSLPWER